MLIYSRAAGLKILDDLKKFTFIYGIVIQGFYICYLVYALIVSAGNLWANIVLALISSAYLAFSVVIHKRPELLSRVGIRKTKHIYNISRLGIRAFTLALTLYGIHIAASHVSTLSIILAALTVMGWTLGVLFELVKFVFEKYFDLMFTAIKADIQPFANVYNKLTRKEAEEKGAPTKTEIYLESLASDYRKELESKKLQAKADKKAKKEAEKKERIEKFKSFFKSKPKALTEEEITANNLEDKKEKITK